MPDSSSKELSRSGMLQTIESSLLTQHGDVPKTMPTRIQGVTSSNVSKLTGLS
jgi:hypothetical protein